MTSNWVPARPGGSPGLSQPKVPCPFHCGSGEPSSHQGHFGACGPPCTTLSGASWPLGSATAGVLGSARRQRRRAQRTWGDEAEEKGCRNLPRPPGGQC